MPVVVTFRSDRTTYEKGAKLTVEAGHLQVRSDTGEVIAIYAPEHWYTAKVERD